MMIYKLQKLPYMLHILIGVGLQSPRVKLAIEENPFKTLGLQRRLILYTVPYPEPSMYSITTSRSSLLHSLILQTFCKCDDVPTPCKVLGKPWFVIRHDPCLVELQRSDRDRQESR